LCVDFAPPPPPLCSSPHHTLLHPLSAPPSVSLRRSCVCCGGGVGTAFGRVAGGQGHHLGTKGIPCSLCSVRLERCEHQSQKRLHLTPPACIGPSSPNPSTHNKPPTQPPIHSPTHPWVDGDAGVADATVADVQVMLQQNKRVWSLSVKGLPKGIPPSSHAPLSLYLPTSLYVSASLRVCVCVCVCMRVCVCVCAHVFMKHMAFANRPPRPLTNLPAQNSPSNRAHVSGTSDMNALKTGQQIEYKYLLLAAKGGVVAWEAREGNRNLIFDGSEQQVQHDYVDSYHYL
jgi:hypothetical protein